MRWTSRRRKREAPSSEVSHSWGTNSWSEPSFSGSAPSSSSSSPMRSPPPLGREATGGGAAPSDSAAWWKQGWLMRTMTVCGTRAKWS